MSWVTYSNHSLRPLPLLKGGRKILALKQKGGWKKNLKRGALTKGVPLLKGGCAIQGKFFMIKFKVKNIGAIAIFRHSRDAKFKNFSNHGGILSKFVAFLAILEMQWWMHH